MNLSPNFTLAEFVESETATRQDIDNDLPVHLLPQAKATAAMLERIRATLSEIAGFDVPIIITSGYRCQALNRAIGSGDGSDHIKAASADWRAPRFGTPTKICQALAPHVEALGIGQLINEFPDGRGWVHTSALLPSKMINRIITIKRRGTFVGIIE